VGNVNIVDGLVGILGCKVSSLTLKYLGLPLIAYFKAKSNWNGVIEKIGHRLAGRKRMCLSKGGRITLIKNLLLFNCALLGKWLWRYMLERGFVEIVVESKYANLWG
jgi:hypothetical protein